MSRTARLFQLMQSLRSHHPPVTAATLADDNGVSLRRLYRNIDALRSLGAIIDGTAGYMRAQSVTNSSFRPNRIPMLRGALSKITAAAPFTNVTATKRNLPSNT